MGDFAKFISTNATEAGGELTEDEFFRATDQAMRYAPRTPGIVTSNAVIDRALADAQRGFERAAALRMEEKRTRRWRVFKRLRLARASADAYSYAVSLERTFRRSA